MLHNIPTLHKFFISISILSLVGYAFFNSRFLLQGPEIVLANTTNNIIHTENKDFILQGNVKHSSYITVNSRPIMVDESGNFNEKLLLSNGVSIIDIYARDKFGKEVREKVAIVYTGDQSSSVALYDKIALRASKISSASTTIEEEETEPMVLTATATTTASSTVMTITPTSGI